MLYICITVCLGTTNSHLRQLCSKISIPYSIVSGLHTSLLLVCKRHCLLPTGWVYLGCRRKCSADFHCLTWSDCHGVCHSSLWPKATTFEKLQKRNNLVTLLGHPCPWSLRPIGVNAAARIFAAENCPIYWLWHFAAQMQAFAGYGRSKNGHREVPWTNIDI